MASTRVTGQAGELLAAQFLRRQRFTILEYNYRCPHGEIDLVALDHGTLVFVEVKARRQDSHGSPFEAVDRTKQRRIQRAALHYLHRHRLTERAVRFDVVGVWWRDDEAQCELLRDAFVVSS
jgi:putative endonuclease